MKKLLFGLLLIGVWPLQAHAVWKAKINKPIIRTGLVPTITVTYSNPPEVANTDPIESFDKDYTNFIDTTTLKRQVVAEIDRLEKLETLLSDVQILNEEFEKSVPYQPTQEELDFMEWFGNYRVYRSMLAAIDQGIKAVDDGDFVTLKAVVHDTFKPEYINYIAK